MGRPAEDGLRRSPDPGPPPLLLTTVLVAGGLAILPTLGTSAAGGARDAGAGEVDPRTTSPVTGGAATFHPAPAAQARQDTVEFRHRDHRGVSCLTCHPSEETHGGLAVDRPGDCLQCHHEADDAPACSRCHVSADLRGSTYSVRRSLDFSTGTATDRSLPFDHAPHEDAACSDCHTEGTALSAGALSCNGCHQEHHRLESDCMACHAPPPDDAHPVEVAHLTCSGSGCHTSMPFEGVPRSRPACLGCHQDLVDHRPGRPCMECHAMPGGGQGGSAAAEGADGTSREEAG